jgi:hypothetical protein
LTIRVYELVSWSRQRLLRRAGHVVDVRVERAAGISGF